MQTSQLTKNSVIALLAVLCTLLWGSAFPGVKLGYTLFSIPTDDPYSKVLFAGYRFALAGLLVLLYTCFRKKKLYLPKRKSWGSIACLGLVQTTLQYIFFYIGLSHTTGVKGAILNCTGTFIAVILSHFFYRDDRLNPQKALGCCIGFLGVILVNLSPGIDSGSFSLTGEGFMILAAACFGVGALISKRATAKEESATVTGYQLLLGGVVLIAIGLAGGGRVSIHSPAGWALFLYLAALSSVAFTVWALLLQHNSVGKITIYNFLVPVFGVLLSALILRENAWEFKNLVALLLVCAGIFIVNRQKKSGNTQDIAPS